MYSSILAFLRGRGLTSAGNKDETPNASMFEIFVNAIVPTHFIVFYFDGSFAADLNNTASLYKAPLP